MQLAAAAIEELAADLFSVVESITDPTARERVLLVANALRNVADDAAPQRDVGHPSVCTPSRNRRNTG